MEKKRCNGCEKQIGEMNKLSVDGQIIDGSIGFFKEKGNIFCPECWRK